MRRHHGFFSFFSIICLLAFVHSARAQITGAVPQVQAVYGGDVGVIASVPVPGETNKTRLFVTTASANSVFHADFDHSLADPYAVTNYFLRVVPDMDANANHGAPSGLAVHRASARMFAACDDGLLSCTIASNSVVTNISEHMNFVLVEGNTLFAIGRDILSTDWDPRTMYYLYYGALDANGMLALGGSNSTPVSSRYITAAINPVTRKLYVVEAANATNMALYKSTSDYDAFSAATTFLSVNIPTNLSIADIRDVHIGFGPDGRLFLGNSGSVADTNDVRLVFSTNDGVSWTDTGLRVGGANVVCNGSASAYEVYYGFYASSNKGESGTWASMSYDSGWVDIDKVNSQVVYCTTLKGLGVSVSRGAHHCELNQGLTAVQINGMDFSASKDIAWLASWAGIRRATNFQTSPEWTDGGLNNPSVACVAVDHSDANSLTVYAGGGGIIYKTMTGGGTNADDWRVMLSLDPNDPVGIGAGTCQSIKVDGSNVYAGFLGSTVERRIGRFYMSPDGGSNWTAVATNIDVRNLAIRTEDETQVVYIAGGKSYSGGSSDGGIYRYVPGAALTRVLTNSVDIRDLAIDSAGGIYACGAEQNSGSGEDPDKYHLVIFYMAPSSTIWSALSNAGLTNNLHITTVQQYGPVITVGKDLSTNDIPILAAARILYYLPRGETNWVSLYTYPNGTQISMLYWDELLVGTTIGLYAQGLNAQPVSAVAVPLAADFDCDAKADPAVFNTNGDWKIKLSSAGYATIPLFGFLGGSGYTALAADFDGDAKADPTIYNADLELWAVKLSSIGYLAPTVLTGFGGAGWAALAGDFDGDRLADPALYNTNSTWKVKLSTAGYATVTTSGFLGRAGWTAVSADFDGDGKVDPAIYNASSGSWIVILSTSNYGVALIDPWFLGSAGYTGLAADFDGDAYSDPAVAEPSSGNWQVKLSSAGYYTIPLNHFLGE